MRIIINPGNIVFFSTTDLFVSQSHVDKFNQLNCLAAILKIRSLRAIYKTEFFILIQLIKVLEPHNLRY